LFWEYDNLHKGDNKHDDDDDDDGGGGGGGGDDDDDDDTNKCQYALNPVLVIQKSSYIILQSL